MDTLPPLPQTLGLATGTIAVAIGLSTLMEPFASNYARTFGLPDRSTQHHFLSASGARNVALGLSILSFGVRGDTKAMGTVIFCATVSAIVDSVLTWKYGVRSAIWVHIGGAIAVAAEGWWLMNL